MLLAQLLSNGIDSLPLAVPLNVARSLDCSHPVLAARCDEGGEGLIEHASKT
ncbi:MAG: hypothetical protein HC838_07790 [Spirulinaceae cyanobacterium RM2_2_10]|nr:hypothetical protein [Spirulinaceae cyanobacterium SM2_1_0]NJO19974.1 hypothetical protein [Spirulinaceae cyanobacterium RM2_2_10]